MPACFCLVRRLPLRSPPAASITENPFIFIPRRLMASFVLCPHRPPQGQRGGCEGRRDGWRDGRLRAPSDATSMWAATDDAASAFVSTVIKRTRNCLLWKTGARLRVQRQRQRRRRLLLFQAWHAWRHWRRDGGAGQRARIKMSLSGPNIRMALSNVGDERESEAERVERHMADKNVYIRIDFSFPLSFVLTY